MFHLNFKKAGKQGKEIKNKCNEDKIVTMNTTILIITLHVNGLTTTIKRDSQSRLKKKENPTICCLQNPILNTKIQKC